MLVAAVLAALLAGAAPGPGAARAASLEPGWPAVAPVQPLPATGPEFTTAGTPGQALAPAATAGRAGQVPPPWRGLVPPPPAISSAAAILMDAASGQVLYEHNARERRPPASTTKILTAIVALEYGNLDDVVTVSEYAAGTEGSAMEIKAGERYTLRELLWGLMLESGNDAAVAIAEHISGSEEAFARLMNETARRLGLRDTHFTNPHGLHHPDHYTTAYDLAVLTRYALVNDYFARLVCQPEKVLCRGAGDWVRILASTNRLLWYHEWVDGVKTGTTDPAGPCLVSSGTRDGGRLIAVVLDSEDRWEDSRRLLEWGFDSFRAVRRGGAGDAAGRVRVTGGARRWVSAVLAQDLAAMVPRRLEGRVRVRVDLPRRVPAPVAAGQSLGWAVLLLDDRELARAELRAGEAVARAPWWRRVLPPW
ncbi:MAG TPA: D-alanyl-D-alanine carboxypeptidase family protein [Thermaerobacter sp.]